MLNRDDIKSAGRLLSELSTLRESKERLQVATDFSIVTFMSDVIVSVPDAEADQIKTVALNSISEHIAQIEEKLRALGVTAD